MEISLPSFFTLALAGTRTSASCSDHLTPQKELPVPTEVRIGQTPRAGVDILENRKISYFQQESNHDSSVLQCITYSQHQLNYPDSLSQQSKIKVSLYTLCRHIGEAQVKLNSFVTLALEGGVVSFTPQPLYLREITPVPTEQEAGWATAPVWTFWRRKNIYQDSNTRLSSLQHS